MVSGGGGNKRDKPGRARQVPPEMDMNLELMLKYWFLLSNLHMVAAGLIFGRLSNFHKIRKPLLFVVILRVWWARWWQLWPQRVAGMASASQPAAGQNPKGDLDRKRATK